MSSPKLRARPPPAAETEKGEEVEAPKATTTSVEPQLLSTTSAQPTNASTRAGGSYEIKIDESKTLQGGTAGWFPTHEWGGYDSSIVWVEEDGRNATVTGLAEGTTTITHKWSAPIAGSGTETFTITVKGVNVYFYTLVPGVKYDPDAAADTQWNGMGIGTISGIGSPSNYDIEETVYGSDKLKDLDITAPTYPVITVGGKDYTYAAPGSPEAMQADHYTIEWTRLKVASGANAGANGVNMPTVPAGTPTYHLDGRVTLIDEDKIQVGFQVKQPNATEFDDPIAKYYLLYDKNVAYNEIVVPGDTDVPPYKSVKGVQYFFDGWYTDEACTQKVDFTSGGTLDKNTTFYGRYVPAIDYLTYDANGGSGDSYTSQGNAATDFEVEVQDNRFTAPEGKVFDSWNTKADGTGETIQPGDTYTLSPDVNDFLYAQWKDDLSSFTVTGGTWLYDGAMHGVTVSGVKVGDTLTYTWMINGDKTSTYSKTITADDIEDDGTVKGQYGPRNVADSGPVSVTLTRGMTTSEPKTDTVTVRPATITVTAEDQTKVWGESDPQLTTTYSGAKNGETPGWAGSVVREVGENPGDYKIMQGTLALANGENGFLAKNYDLEFVSGTLTIIAADDGDDDTPVTPVDPVDPGDDDDNPGGGGDDTNPGGGGTTTGGGTNPVPVAVTAGDDTDDADDTEDEETVEEDETPLTDGTESDSEQIGDDTTPLAPGEASEQTCWTHWVMLAGLGVTVVYFALSAARTRRATNELASFEDDVLGGR